MTSKVKWIFESGELILFPRIDINFIKTYPSDWSYFNGKLVELECSTEEITWHTIII